MLILIEKLIPIYYCCQK